MQKARCKSGQCWVQGEDLASWEGRAGEEDTVPPVVGRRGGQGLRVAASEN